MNKRKLPLLLAILPMMAFGQITEDNDSTNKEIDEVVITGTMKEVSKSNSPVPVEIYSTKFLQKNPTPSLLESVGRINGIRPQLNCSVCNTGDIHINGLEGPYTMILIDGMPIVSSLSTVYGLSGIPTSLIERIEVVKGPASSLYGSEAMGGIINVITKNSLTAPTLTTDLSASTLGEYNADLGVKYNLGENVSSILSLNYFNFQNRKDRNKDNFIDTTLQDRISVFNKYDFKRKNNRQASLAVRYMYEDRLGGVLDFDKHQHRGGTDRYGESIYTNRAEVIARYQLPTSEKIYSQFSFNYHDQDSFYGDTSFQANQKVTFGQVYWDKTAGKHDLLLGVSLRHDYYDDNTVGTLSKDGSTNNPTNTLTQGIFIQDEIKFSPVNTLLLGYRLDHNENHGFVHSPRFAYKYSPEPNLQLRLSFGTGFRVVNLFTEDHAALTGSREVIIKNDLNPERSYNGNLNIVKKFNTSDNGYVNFDLLGFYTYFTNKIVGNYDNDDQIIFDNLDGHAVSAGVSFNTDIKFEFPLTINAGVTYMEVFEKYQEKRETQFFAPKWSGKYTASYQFPAHISLDLTGELYGPMRLPTVENDFRSPKSPWYNIMNVMVKKKWSDFEVYAGVKNLLDFTPDNPLFKPEAPFSNEFDTAYGYAPMTGIRGFFGVKYNIK